MQLLSRSATAFAAAASSAVASVPPPLGPSAAQPLHHPTPPLRHSVPPPLGPSAASPAATAAASPTPRATSAATSAISTAISHSSLAAHRSVRQRHSADVEPLQLLAQSPPRTPTSPSARAPTAALTTDCSCDAAIAAALNADVTTHPAAPAAAQRLTSTTTTHPAAPAAAQHLTSTTSTPGGTIRKFRASPALCAAALPPTLPASLGGNRFNALQHETPSPPRPCSARAAATSPPSARSAAVSPSAAASRSATAASPPAAGSATAASPPSAGSATAASPSTTVAASASATSTGSSSSAAASRSATAPSIAPSIVPPTAPLTAPPPSSGHQSPKAVRTATVLAAEATPPHEGTNQRTSLREAELEELLEASNRMRMEVEAALMEAETALTAAQLEMQRVQTDGAADETLSISSEGSRPSQSDDDEALDALLLDAGCEVERSGVRARPPVADAFGELMASRAKQQERRAASTAAAAAEAAKTAARAARRAEVKALGLPTELQPSSSTADWEGWMFARAEKQTQEKRKKPIDNSATAPQVPKPRKGRHGWRHNSRLGLIGAVRYWANGSRDNVVNMLLGLISEFDVADAVRAKLFQKANRQVETDRLIVDRLVDALEVLKGCQTEQQRKDFLLALSLVAPQRAATRDGAGRARRVAARLRVSRGKRSKRRGERPYAFETAMVRREAFDAAKARYSRPIGPLLNGQQRALVPDALQVGEKVLTHNGPAELTRFTDDGGCVVTYRIGDDYAERKYSECYSKAKGSARLRRMPPSLTPPPRATSALSLSDATRKAILDHFATTCPTSPHTRDVMRRRVGPFVIQEKVRRRT